MFAFPAVILYLLLFLPFIGVVPYLDGNTEFIIASNFYFGKYFSHWIPYHPPMKLFLSNILFHTFGFSAYSGVGYALGLIGIYAMYVIAKSLFDKKTALIATIFLGGSGLYV